ncbi:MAG: hypothetical protein IKU86_03840 [Thermoguttaceae bacterium]|nr:hypothetical protein [Thermoguttaceae bacterium]
MPAPAPRTPDFNDADVRRAEKALLARVAKTRADVRRVDLTTAFCAFATLALGVLFVGVLLDHWVLPDGLSPRGRLLFAVAWVASTTLYFVVRLVPILRRQIAPLYAAKILEESWNDPHNSAISWLQLRREAADARRRSQKAQKTRNKETAQNKQNGENAQNADSNDSADVNAVVDPSILRGVALQAATRAESAPVETLVDCSGLIRWGVAFAVVVAVCAGYSVFSPKSPFASVGRIVAPTAAIERPQAVALEEVSPGDATVYQGDFLDVAAKIDGAGSLPVEIFYSTEDGRLVDLRVPMKPVGASRFEARFPDGDEGFSEPLTYRVVVGAGGRFESVSPTYRVDVKPRPTFQVEKTTLKFPDYTGLTPQTFANQGDVRAVEGTTVEIVARSNSPLESALFLPNGDESKGEKMTISPDNPRLATFEFRLDWKRTSSILRGADAEEKVPALTSYRLLSIDVDGQRNRDARDYSVETLADVPPTIRWESAPESGSTAALNDALRFQVWAEDPDFGLRSVRVRTAIRDLDEGASAVRSTPAPIDLPLRSRSAKSGADYSTGPTPFVGPNVLSGAFVPEQLGFRVGDEIEYWVEAVDSKEPEANVAATEKLLVVVGEPVANPSSPNAPPEEGPENPENGESGSESGNENGQNAGESEQNSENGQNDGESETGENGESKQNNQSGENSQTGQNQPSNQSEPNAQNQQGGESGESGQDAQNQQDGENQETGQSGGSERERQNEQNGATGQGGASDAANGDDSNASEQSGQNRQNQPNGENEPSREAGQNGENAQNGDANSPALGAPESVDPEANPGDAFEKALDFIRSERENGESGAQGSESNAESLENGRSERNSENNQNAQNRKSPNNAQDGENEQSGENGNSGENPRNGEKSNGRRPLPNRTSDERPGENAERFDAENPEKIDPNSRREKGEVDRSQNNFLAQNAPDDAPENPNGAPDDANVLADPLENFAGNGTDAAPNAQELKGANNAETDPNGASEPDRDPTGSENEGNSENRETLNPGEVPSDALGGGGGSDSASDATGSDQNAENNGGGSASDRQKPSTGPKSDEQEGTIGAGGDSRSGKRGGGGGSGLGELGPDEASLTGADAPRLQYAEAATNLVLDYLDDVLKEKADRRILDELGWTDEQLRAFLERWKAMKAAAENGDENAKVEYLQALENLGLDAPDASKPIDATVGRSPDDRRRARNDAVREDRRTKTPTSLDERVRAFNRGVSTGARNR